jgi:hypothetical protein
MWEVVSRQEGASDRALARTEGIAQGFVKENLGYKLLNNEQIHCFVEITSVTFVPMDVSSSRSRAGILEPAETQVEAGSFLSAADAVTSIASALSVRVRRSPLPIEIQWTALLNRWRWHWFATFTFKDETHPEAAAKVFRHWVNLLDESNGYRQRSASTYSRRCTWARGLEWQKRGVIHFHAVLGNLPISNCTRASCEAWAHLWLELGNTGFAKIILVQDEGAMSYVSKYCAKGGEIDLSPNLVRPDLVGTAESK